MKKVNLDKKDILKISAVGAVGVLVVYLIISIIMYFVMWSVQPRFEDVASGAITFSQGFGVQILIFTGFFLIAGALEFILVKIFYFGKNKKSKSDSSVTADSQTDK